VLRLLVACVVVGGLALSACGKSAGSAAPSSTSTTSKQSMTSKRASLPSAAIVFENDYTVLEEGLDSVNSVFVDAAEAASDATLYKKYLDALEAYKWPKATGLASRSLEKAIAALVTASERAALDGAYLDSQQYGTAGLNKYNAEGWMEYTLGIISDASCLWVSDNPAVGKRSAANYSQACSAAGIS